MDTLVGPDTDDLAALGLSRAEIELYLALLDGPRLTAARLADACNLDMNVVRVTLSRLQRTGLVTIIPGSPARYGASPPRVAIDHVARLRREEIDRAHRTLAGILERNHNGLDHPVVPDDPIEILQGHEMIATRARMLLQGARAQVIAFGRPWERSEDERPSAEMAVLHRGVAVRVILERDDPSLDARIGSLEDLVAAGERARWVDLLPCRMLVVDRRRALLVDRDDHANAIGIMGNDCVLVDTLFATFDAIWTRGTPVCASADAPEDGSPSEDERALLALMSAGLKDQAIARNLGVAVRTVERRVKRLMTSLGADTRFQVGMLAARRGWMDDVAATGRVPEGSASRHRERDRRGT